MADAELWTVERANAALPRVEAALLRIRDLVAEARRERDDMAGLREGNGHPATPRGAEELRAAVEALTGEGIILRDLDGGLVDFPGGPGGVGPGAGALPGEGIIRGDRDAGLVYSPPRLDAARRYLLCWVLGEPA